MLKVNVPSYELFLRSSAMRRMRRVLIELSKQEVTRHAFFEELQSFVDSLSDKGTPPRNAIILSHTEHGTDYGWIVFSYHVVLHVDQKRHTVALLNISE